MQLGPVKVADALGGLFCGRHGDEAVAASARALGVCHHLGSNNLDGLLGNRDAKMTPQFLNKRPCNGRDQWLGLTLPYLLKSVFRSVALVVEERPLTHRFLLLLAAAPPPAAAAAQTHTNQ